MSLKKKEKDMVQTHAGAKQRQRGAIQILQKIGGNKREHEENRERHIKKIRR